MKKLLVLALCLLSFPAFATDITASGSYSCADCKLTSNISGTLTFTASGAFIDMNGKTVDCGSSGNTADHGITLPTNGKLFDSVGTGKITHCWSGVDHASGSSAIGVNIDATRYFGHYVDAAGVTIKGGSVKSVNGVTNESYSIGVQVGAANALITGVIFRNFYTQTGFTGSLVYEGLPVNCSSSNASNCQVIGNIAINDTAEPHTIGIFAGTNAATTIRDNIFINYEVGIMAYGSTGNLHTIENNTVWLKTPLTGSRGIEGGHGNSSDNLIIGYESAYKNASNTTTYPPIVREDDTVFTGRDGVGFFDYPVTATECEECEEPGGEGFDDIFQITLDTAMGPWTPANTYVSTLEHARFTSMPSGTPTTIKVQVCAGPSGFSSDGFYVAHRPASGDIYDFAATAVQLLVSGSGSFTIPASSCVWGEAAFVYDKSSGVTVAIQDSGSGGHDLKAKVAATAIYKGFYKAGKDASTTNKTGYSHLGGSDANNKHTFIQEIQVDGF